MGDQAIICISCSKHFRVTVPATRVRRHWFGRRVDSHVVISAQSRPRVQPLLELQSDAKAVVIEPLAIDHLSENRRCFFHGSDLHLFTRLSNAPGKHAGTVGTDVIGVGPFCIVGRQLPHPRQAYDDNDGKSFLPPAIERRTHLRVTRALARRGCRSTRLILRRAVGCLRSTTFSVLVRGRLPLRAVLRTFCASCLLKIRHHAPIVYYHSSVSLAIR